MQKSLKHILTTIFLIFTIVLGGCDMEEEKGIDITKDYVDQTKLVIVNNSHRTLTWKLHGCEIRENGKIITEVVVNPDSSFTSENLWYNDEYGWDNVIFTCGDATTEGCRDMHLRFTHYSTRIELIIDRERFPGFDPDVRFHTEYKNISDVALYLKFNLDDEPILLQPNESHSIERISYKDDVGIYVKVDKNIENNDFKYFPPRIINGDYTRTMYVKFEDNGASTWII